MRKIEMSRYKPVVSGGEVDESTVLCTECTTRTRVVAVLVEDIEEHDEMHAKADQEVGDK